MALLSDSFSHSTVVHLLLMWTLAAILYCGAWMREQRPDRDVGQEEGRGAAWGWPLGREVQELRLVGQLGHWLVGGRSRFASCGPTSVIILRAKSACMPTEVYNKADYPGFAALALDRIWPTLAGIGQQ